METVSATALTDELTTAMAAQGITVEITGVSVKVTGESARAWSCYSVSTGMQTATRPGCTIFDNRIKSVLYTFCSVKKCFIHSI